ncbi:MAG: glycine--tRNA ligase [Bacteroidetes bacterium]|nr:glycine--tRNA ligase [Bacteroidota bacterium]
MAEETNLSKVIAHCKEYGFIFPSSEIYGNLGAVYDYGPFGTPLKNNIREYWWKAMVQMHDNIVGIDAAILMHPTTWKASGHVDSFNDPLIDNKDSKKRYRADVLLEDYIAKIDQKISKEIAKGKKRFGGEFDEAQFTVNNPNVQRNLRKKEDVTARMVEVLENNDLEGMRQLIIDLDIACPVSGSRNWTEVRQFNLMFGTKLGSLAEESTELYLRPETAQGIFVNFLNVQKSARMKIPFGIAQTGKAFRNEIVARQFVFRMREFEQMEMQFFIRPGEQKKWFDYWKKTRMNWHLALGSNPDHLKFHEHEKLAHYADAAEDVQFKFPIGFKELEGIHSRTDFDLSSHEEFSGKKLRYFDPELNENYVPYVIETSIGLDRMFLRVVSEGLKEEVVDAEKGTSRLVLKIPPALCPVKVAVFPLVRKDGLDVKAKEIFNELKFVTAATYEEKDAIGKRYRRMDAVGTPYCITVDHQTLEDNTVTIRERDSMSQERIPVCEIEKIVLEKVDMNQLLRAAMP